MSVIDEIAAERRRQIESEGWSAEHDDTHRNGELALAAANYALHAHLHNPDRWGPPWVAPTERQYQQGGPTTVWPWAYSWWKPKNPRRDLVRAAALIVAEIERLDRAAVTASEDA